MYASTAVAIEVAITSHGGAGSSNGQRIRRQRAEKHRAGLSALSQPVEISWHETFVHEYTI